MTLARSNSTELAPWEIPIEWTGLEDEYNNIDQSWDPNERSSLQAVAEEMLGQALEQDLEFDLLH